MSQLAKVKAKSTSGPALFSPTEARAGFGIIEIVVVLAIIVTVFAGLLQLAALQSQIGSLVRHQSKAYLLARESIEATRFVRDQDWPAFAGLANNARYYPIIAGNAWTLSPADPGPIDGFSRWVELAWALRDGAGNIADGGTADLDTRKVVASVEWTERSGDIRTITLETYLTNWQSFR